MDYQSEFQLEEMLVGDLAGRNYERVEIRDVESLERNFREVLFRANSEKLGGKPFSDKEIERIRLHMDGKSIYQSAKILRDQYVLVRDNGEEVYIDFLNTEFNKNVYQVTNQITVEGKYTNRYDVTLLVNGLPLVQIELKRRGMDMKEAFNQIMRYKKHSFTGLYRFAQIFVVSNGVNTRYFANNDGEINYGNAFYWADAENNRISMLSEFSETFLNRVFLTKVLTKYFVINDTDKSLIVMRPYQIYATEALVNKALNTTSDGYVWHTTGSGKTLTSFKAAQIIAQDARVKKVFFLVDRKDLDAQTTQEFNKFEANSVDSTDSTGILVKQIKDIKRTLIVTTIQKMANAVSSKRYAKAMSAYADEKVIFLVDECHRSQFGKMTMMVNNHFKKAQYFGFTGTPRFSENKSQDGRTTADMYGKCLHTYLIKEAIHDNNVLGFNVEYIQTFKGQYKTGDETKVEAINKEEALESETRIGLVANHIVNHHNLKTRNKQYTALFTIASVPLLIKYYDRFKTIDHDLKIAAVFSYGQNEDAEGRDEHSRDSLERMISDYNEEHHTNFSTHTFSSYNADISKKVKTGQIDILLVVNMYTTGFDSKPLSTLYVDKKLQFHNLLQAFSRTNRVEKASKPFGNIVCYRNLKGYTDEAIKLFSMTDNVDDVLLKEYGYYREKFRDAVKYLMGVVKSPIDVDALKSEDDKKNFIIAFRELTKNLLVLQSFSEFEFTEVELHIGEQTYQDFKSKYLDLYEDLKRVGEGKNKVSILDDIDFSVELMHTDRINVAYILKLIKSIDFSDHKSRDRDVKHILKELDRTDNPQLRNKVELIKAFLEDIVPTITPEDSVDDVFNEFEHKEKNREIEEFAKENEMDEALLARELTEVAYSGDFNKERIRAGLSGKMTFLQKNRLIEKVKVFIETFKEKYE